LIFENKRKSFAAAGVVGMWSTQSVVQAVVGLVGNPAPGGLSIKSSTAAYPQPSGRLLNRDIKNHLLYSFRKKLLLALNSVRPDAACRYYTFLKTWKCRFLLLWGFHSHVGRPPGI
jgi:hypothetical protein